MNSTFGKGFGIKKYPGNNDSFDVESRGSDLDKTNNADLAYMLNHLHISKTVLNIVSHDIMIICHLYIYPST